MISTYSLFEYLLELNQESANELISIHSGKPNMKTQLIFPFTQNTKKLTASPPYTNLRVSEQELRFVMTHLHHHNNRHHLSYAIEVPTVHDYTFSGSNSRSGSTDLAFYDGNDQVLNIELKAKVPTQASVDKDIEKLVREPSHGAWCHILEGQDRGTLQSIFEKLKIGFDKTLKNNHKLQFPLFFSFLILHKRVLISRKGVDGEENNFNPTSIFSLDYNLYDKFIKSNSINCTINDWQINKY